MMTRPLYLLRQVAEIALGIAEVLLGVGVVDRWSDRDRRRRIAAMLDRERSAHVAAAIVNAQAMASQLAEIQALPEAAERLR